MNSCFLDRIDADEPGSSSIQDIVLFVSVRKGRSITSYSFMLIVLYFKDDMTSSTGGLNFDLILLERRSKKLGIYFFLLNSNLSLGLT